MANSPNIPLPNPFTPMAFLPPEEAYQWAIAQYMIVGGLGVLTWDILTHLHSDYKLSTQYRISPPTIIYLISRWSTLFYLVLTSVFQTSPVGNCVVLAKLPCAVYHVTVSSTAFLFFLRVRAIFSRNIYITAGFLFLWISVLGGGLTSVLSLSGEHIGTTQYCTFSNFKSYRSAANITLAVFDTFVFVAITWRLSNIQLSIMKNEESVLISRFDLLGRYLPAFSKELLRDGQKYYLVAMLANLLVLALNFAPGIPEVYRSIFLAPAAGITNIMTCRVFRNTKMAHDSEDVRTVSKITFRRSNNVSLFVRTQDQWDGQPMSFVDGNGHQIGVPKTEVPSTSSHILGKAGHISRENVPAHSIV